MRPRKIVIACAAGLVIAVLCGSRASAQCILANPSFELPGAGGIVFRGWKQFGPVGSTTIASHGAKAARLIGTDTGNWDVSAFWQPRTCSPGERWALTGHVRHPASRPLAGQNVAIVNVEWRVKGPGWYGPGYNYFTNATDRVWVDGNGYLHLTLKNSGSLWGATEVATLEALGYGDYSGNLARFDAAFSAGEVVSHAMRWLSDRVASWT